VEEFLPVLLIFLLGFGFFLWIFSRSNLIPMVDGPYYLIQIKSILTTGSLAYYGDPPLTFYLLSIFSFLLGDIALGVKVGVSFFCALSTIPAYFLMKKVGKSSFAGVVAMLLIIFSASYIRMLTDFMKNAVGVFFLFAFIYYLHDLAFSGAKRSGLNKRSLILATFFLVLAGMTHILDFSIALLFFAIYTASVLIFDANRRPFMKAAGVITLAISAFILIATVFFGSLFNDFSSVLSFIHDLTSQTGGAGAAEAIPSSLNPGPIQSASQPFSNGVDIIGGWGIILLIMVIGIILCFYAWKKKQKESLVLLTAATALCSIICFPLIPSDWLFRTSLMIVVPAAIILSYGISAIWNSGHKKSKLIAAIIFAVCLVFFVGQSFRIIKDIRPLVSDEGYLDLVNMKDQIPADSIVFTEHGMHYWVEYVDEVKVAGTSIEELSPELWKSYSHVLFIFSKDKLPPIAHEDIFIGKALLLAEVQQSG
jgi:4-amino-4-deoxy-L-arabinose transferase-like glycosyltransferase